MGLSHKLFNTLLRASLITIYLWFIRPHLDYGDIIYDQVYINSFHQKMELMQCSASLAISNALYGTMSENLYQELRLESHQYRRCYRKLLFFIIHLKPNSKLPTTCGVKLGKCFSKIRSFLWLYMLGTNWIQI